MSGAPGRLAGRRVLVTGGGTGIGRATALRLAAEGAAVAVADIRVGDADETARQVTDAAGTAHAYELDVGDEAQTSAVVAAVTDRLGGLDGLFANAGIVSPGRTHELTLEDWNRVLAVNLTGVFLTVKHALTPMVDGGGGSIVVTGSVSSVVNGLGGGAVAYKASKGGALQLTGQGGQDRQIDLLLRSAVAGGDRLQPLPQGGIELGVGEGLQVDRGVDDSGQLVVDPGEALGPDEGELTEGPG